MTTDFDPDHGVAMLAPSFPVQFPYPQIVGRLKRLGFDYVVEVAFGALETNRQLLSLLEKNHEARYITSPCPAIVQRIQTQYPHLVKFLAPTPSPMLATAKFVAEKFPGKKIVFIGPCLMKKIEAKNYPELEITVLTYQELIEIFSVKNQEDSSDDFLASFDQIGSQARLYAISGGLAQSAGLNSLLSDEEYDVVSGPILTKKALDEFPTNNLRVLDILNCEGGCLAGPGIVSNLSLEQRRLKIVAHWAKSAK